MIENLSKQFHALSDPNRLTILARLASGETCGCTIINQLLISQPTLSYHLNIMTNSGLLRAYKQGTRKKHQINREEIKVLITYLQGLLKEEK